MRKLLAVAAAAFAAVAVQATPALAADTECTGALTGTTIEGDLIVPAGARCVLTNVHVTGDVIVEPSASLDALNTRIEGNIDCSGGPSAEEKWCDLESGTVVEGNGIARAGGELHLHGGQILGNVRAQPDSVFVATPEEEGQPAATALVGGNVRCNGCIFLDLIAATVGGDVHIAGLLDGSFIVEGTEIFGDLEIVGSAAGAFAFLIAGNTIHRNVEFRRNMGPALIEGNSIGRNLRVFGNRSAGEFCDPANPEDCISGLTVADNQVERTLVCRRNDPAPVGGGNTAKRKRGQCREL